MQVNDKFFLILVSFSKKFQHQQILVSAFFKLLNTFVMKCFLAALSLNPEEENLINDFAVSINNSISQRRSWKSSYFQKFEKFS